MTQSLITKLEEARDPMPFVCIHADPRCEDDPCPWGVARFLCNAPAAHPARATAQQKETTT